MDVIAAYREVGTYRGAAVMCGTTHKTVRRIITAAEAGDASAPVRRARVSNYEGARELVAAKVARTAGRITAKRLLPDARAAGYEGSARNFRVWGRRRSGRGGWITTGGGARRCGRRVRRC
jgi:hypothetical protein